MKKSRFKLLRLIMVLLLSSGIISLASSAAAEEQPITVTITSSWGWNQAFGVSISSTSAIPKYTPIFNAFTGNVMDISNFVLVNGKTLTEAALEPGLGFVTSLLYCQDGVGAFESIVLREWDFAEFPLGTTLTLKKGYPFYDASGSIISNASLDRDYTFQVKEYDDDDIYHEHDTYWEDIFTAEVKITGSYGWNQAFAVNAVSSVTLPKYTPQYGWYTGEISQIADYIRINGKTISEAALDPGLAFVTSLNFCQDGGAAFGAIVLRTWDMDAFPVGTTLTLKKGYPFYNSIGQAFPNTTLDKDYTFQVKEYDDDIYHEHDTYWVEILSAEVIISGSWGWNQAIGFYIASTSPIQAYTPMSGW